ncbi:UNVERIFIED_ORG: PhoH family protein [Roseateles sp. XES5]|nr:PhoH family protein [Roseateles sp. XES5]
MNGHELMTSSPRQSKNETDANQFVLTFENNRYASELFGQFDQNLKLIEQRLHIDARARGNSVSISGDVVATGQARRALDYLYDRLQKGGSIELSDVEGAIRMAIAADDQLSLPTMERKAKLTMAQISTRKKTIAARTPTQDTYIRAMERSELVFGIGPAGTGKTFLAVACAVDALERSTVQRIILTRPAVEAGERLGFLPGDLTQKVDPYLRPLYDALYDLMGFDRVNKAFEKGQLEIAPLAFMRGRTLNHAFVILDEAQNTTPEQMKMFLTRIGENGRMIVTGDPSQVDLPRGVKSGLVEALQILKGVEGVSVVRFKDVDVVRHPMVARIVRAYEAQTAVQDESEQLDR